MGIHRLRIPVYTRLNNTTVLMGSVTAGTTSIGAAKIAKTPTAIKVTIHKLPAWMGVEENWRSKL